MGRPPTDNERLVWELIRETFARYGIISMEKAGELWFIAWNRGVVERKRTSGSISETIETICQWAMKEGILYKFQPETPPTTRGPEIEDGATVAHDIESRRTLKKIVRS
jgi:hypothetical protein